MQTERLNSKWNRQNGHFAKFDELEQNAPFSVRCSGVYNRDFWVKWKKK